MTKIHVANLNFGYVECSHAASINLHNAVGFDTRYKALESLANCLMNQFLDGHRVVFRSCCEANKGKHSFCHDCGRNLKEAEFNPLEDSGWGSTAFGDWLNQWWTLNTNDMEFDEYMFEDWWPWLSVFDLIKFEEDNIVCLREKAENYLPMFLSTEVFPGLAEDINQLRDGHVKFRNQFEKKIKSWDDVRHHLNETSAL